MVEIIVVIGILTVIIAFGMVIDLNVFKGDTFRAEEATIVSILEKARSRAMANMFESPHGVCYISPDYVIFRDGICDKLGTDETVPSNTNITVSFISATSVIFNQLAGTTTGATIRITDGVKIEDIIINNEGRINW